jgi:hypothetical protein
LRPGLSAAVVTNIFFTAGLELQVLAVLSFLIVIAIRIALLLRPMPHSLRQQHPVLLLLFFDTLYR